MKFILFNITEVSEFCYKNFSLVTARDLVKILGSPMTDFLIWGMSQPLVFSLNNLKCTMGNRHVVHEETPKDSGLIQMTLMVTNWRKNYEKKRGVV